MISFILFFAPGKGFPVQIGDVKKGSSNQKVFFYKSNQPFYFSFCKRVSWLTQFCLKANGFHENFIVFLPYRITFKIPMKNNTFHVVCQNVSGDTHVAKGMDHPDKQVLLFCIREKFDVLLPAVMTDHRKTGHCVFRPIIVQDFGEAPIHLIGISWFRCKSFTTIACGATSCLLAGTSSL